MMTQELRNEYQRAIQERDDELLLLKEALRSEKIKVSEETVRDWTDEFKVLHDWVIAKGAKAQNTEMPFPRQYPDNRGKAGKSVGFMLQPSQNQLQIEPDPFQLKADMFDSAALREVIGL